MEELLSRMWNEIVARPDGPLAFRFYFQPLMAILLASRDGWRDARMGRPAFLWCALTDRSQFRQLLGDAWKSIRKVFLLAMGLDIVYQILVLRSIRPVETLIVASLLALVPYALLRGPANRLARIVIPTDTNSRRAA